MPKRYDGPTPSRPERDPRYQFAVDIQPSPGPAAQDDETGVEFTITHTFVDPSKRDEQDRLQAAFGIAARGNQAPGNQQ